MPQSKIFFYACLFFIFGVFIRSVFALDFFWLYLILLGSVFFLILFRVNKYFLILGIWGVFLFFGLWRYQLFLPQSSPDRIYYYNGRQVEFSGLVDQEPDQREDNVKLDIDVKQIKLGDKVQKVTGKVLVTNFTFPEYKYGDQLDITCDLQQPEAIDDFQYDQYLARYDIYSLCYYPKINKISENNGNFILSQVYNLKNYFSRRLNQILPEPQSSFLGGLLIGAKKAIPADLQSDFNKTGTTHIVAVSGYNITIIATFLMLIAGHLGIGRKKSFWLILGFLIVFLMITGLQASILRAAIMGSLVLLAGYLGRLSMVKNALALTVVIMLLFNPKLLVYDLGFQLSFLATLGLVYLNPVLVKLTKIENCKLPIVKLIAGDYLLTTLSAIIMTQPLILYQFGKISLIAPIANILVLPFIPLAMLFGFISGIAAMIWTGLGWVIGWSVWLVLSYIIWVLEKLAGLNWAYWEIPKIGVGLMAIMYIILLGVIYLSSWRRQNVNGA